MKKPEIENLVALSLKNFLLHVQNLTAKLKAPILAIIPTGGYIL
jgi:hypothetical protein